MGRAKSYSAGSRTLASVPTAPDEGAVVLAVPRVHTLAETRRLEAAELMAELRASPLTVRTDAQAEQVGGMIAELAAEKRELDVAMKAIVKPINEGLKQVKALFKPAIDALDGCERTLRDALGTYRVAQHTAVLAARDAAMNAIEAGDTEALHKALAAPDPMTSDSATTTRFNWAVKHVQEWALPREFLTADLSKLNAYARATSGQDEIEPIPGVIFERKAVVIRK
jgi:hypothetical protein